MVFYKISFSQRNAPDGLFFILGEGPGRWAGKRGQYWVTDQALKRLDESGIPYRVLVGKPTYRPVESK